ncbi:MAG: response regulator [Gammaproteobacteria bacterium]|nr:response regulator [Gammaproteobacteria bacterium]
MSKRAVLCIDDDETVLLTLRSLLKSSLEKGLIIEAAESGEEALEIVDELAAEGVELEAVISDYIMPGMKGDEVLKKIHQRCPKAVTIMLTGQSNLQGVTNAINQANLYRFLEKPWQNDDLLLTIKSAIHSYQQEFELEQSNARLKLLNENLESVVKQRTHELSKKSGQVRQLLDSSGQGFLSFFSDLKIQGECSSRCYQFFSVEEMAGQFIYELLYSRSEEQQALLKKNLQRFFKSEDRMRRELILELLPREYQLQNFIFSAEYRPMEKDQLMLILSDITQKKRLQEKINANQERFKFIVTVLKEINDVQQIMREFHCFLEQCSLAAVDVVQLYRDVHTFKGLFLQFGFPTLPMVLHRVETELNQLQGDLVAEQVEGFSDLKIALMHDLAEIEQVLGQGFCHEDRLINIPESRIIELQLMVEELAQSKILADEQAFLALLHRVRTVCHVDFRSLLSGYPKAMMQLAARLNKEIEPFSIEGDLILIDATRFNPLVKTLVHVFRNAMVHGIESPEERIERGKLERGQLTCHVLRKKGALVVEIGDDGRGMDADLLRQFALDKGVLDQQSVGERSDAEIFQLIFTDDFSTTEDVDSYSGRGVGLSAVQDKLERLGGSIQVKSKKGCGTSFQFTLPIDQ